MTTVIFDLDGTLADTSGDLLSAANERLAGAGHGEPLDPGTDQGTAVRGALAMLRLGAYRAGLRSTEIEEFATANYRPLLEAYESRIDERTRLYDGAVEALEILRNGGARLGVCTNKPERLADLLLSRLGIRDFFSSLVGGDSLPVRKPDPSPLFVAVDRAGGIPGNAVLVGDNDTDRRTGRAAGIPVILVTFGPAGDTVSELAPEGLIDQYDTLADEVARVTARNDSD